MNLVRAGSAVPIKFSLGGDRGLDILVEGSPSSRRHHCFSSETGDLLESVVASGASTLTYNVTTGIYTYVWKTSRAWQSTCRTLVLDLVDGGSYEAEFLFR